jgi:anti-sigma factor RsiW
MNCNQVRELLPDVAAGMGAGAPEVETHISSCSTCAAKLQGLRQTMALLDEWQAPEPSAYFDTRLQARMREEMARPAAGWLHWIRRPALAASLAAVIVAGGLMIGNRGALFPEQMAINDPVVPGPIEPGTAVGDLQALERNHDLYADFDMLDELQVQNDVTANP